MIPLFNKLQSENLLKQKGILLDLGCGNGRVSEPFFQYGYETILVDKNAGILSEAEDRFKKIKKAGFRIVNIYIENFDFNENYDGIIMSNVLPFQKSKENVEKIVQKAFDKLNKGGFLFFTLFGTRDGWVQEHKDRMIFCEKAEAIGIIKAEPYFISEDYGQGLTMKGDIKTWHIFNLLYIKQ
jgi:SAM-dependent methyltransferase